MELKSSFHFRGTVTGRYRVQKPSNPHFQELGKNDRLVATGALIFIYLATHLLFSTRRWFLKVQSLSVTCGGEEITTRIRKVGQRDNLYFKVDPSCDYGMSDVRVFEIDFTFTVGYKYWLQIGS
jgi:hypothetical protein